MLCEKPLTANATEAEQVAAVAQRTGRVADGGVPLALPPARQRWSRSSASGELGALRHVETALCFPLPMFSDIRYQYDLAGGAMMDVGCYAVHMVRTLGGEEPEVGHRRRPSCGTPTSIVRCAPNCGSRADTPAASSARCGRRRAPVARPGASAIAASCACSTRPTPQIYHRLRVTTDGHSRDRALLREPTYEYQLEAFCAAVLRGEPTLTPPSDSVANMRVIDAIYRAAGMKVRGT